MAFVRLIATAQNLNKYKNDLIKEKQASIDFRTTGKRKFKLKWIGVRIRGKLTRLKRRIGYCFCGRKFCFNLKHVGSIQNYVLKSFLGFLGGLILTYIFFMIFVFQLNLKISTATVICSVLGCILVNGLAFSTKIRCIVLLTLPHFFGERGRQLLVAYALVLVMSGPAQNILNNLGILSESLACGQEQLKSALRQIFEVIKKPFYAIKDAIKKVVATVKTIIKTIKDILIKIKRIIMAIIKVIKAAFMFLAKIINICNKELGTPFERCERVFDNAIADCNAKLGPIFSWMCSITYIVKTVCYLVKIFDFVCMLVDFIKNSIVGVVIRKVKGFVRHIRTMFYVRIKFSHSFHFETKASKSIAEISKEIVDEVKDRIKTIAAVFQIIFSAASLFLIFMIVKVLIYRYKFLTNDGFDNNYITEDFFQLDIRRAKHNKETVLPLNPREAKLYVKVKSSKLTAVESKKLRKAIMNLVSVNLKAAIYMAVDYALFWILNMIKFYGKFQSKVQVSFSKVFISLLMTKNVRMMYCFTSTAPNIPIPNISGNGILADLLRSIVMAFQPMGLTLEIDTVPCLPVPIPPDYDRYIQIVTLLIICWVLTILEPYGLRLRTYIMTYYHPIRGKQRAIWLYNKILRKRSTFLKFARRQLRRKIFGSKDIDKVTIKEFLSAHFRLFAMCFDKSQTACLLCGKVFRESDSEKPIRCATPECPGIYCDQCFADLRNLCTVCLSPIEYGDLSDLSEERDSSEDEKPKNLKKRKRKRKWTQVLSQICRKNKSLESEDEEIPLFVIPKASKQSLKEEKRKSWQDFGTTEETTSFLGHENEKVVRNNYDIEVDEIEERSVEDEEAQVDSGNVSTTSVSTDYSYSYQYSKEDQRLDSPEIPDKDVEKQEILDYASMDSFRDDYNEELNEGKGILEGESGKEFVKDEEDMLSESESEVMDEEKYGIKKKNKIDKSSQILEKEKVSKQTSTEQILCPKTAIKSEKVDFGTVFSGETIKNTKPNRHIDFVEPKRKLKKRRRKTRTVICTCSDSNEEGIPYWEKTSMVAVPKTARGSRYHQKVVKCKCKRTICICKMSNVPAEEENTTDSQSYSSSSELRSLLEPREKSDDKTELKEPEREPKKSKLKMFIRRIIPKYKIQHEK